MPAYEKCKVFTCSHACNLHVIIDSVPIRVNAGLGIYTGGKGILDAMKVKVADSPITLLDL